MAIVTAHGQEIDLGNGVKRSFVSIADISTASILLAKGADGIKRRIVSAQLQTSAAVGFEIKDPSATTAKYYAKPSSAGLLDGKAREMNIVSEASDGDSTTATGRLMVEGDTAAALYGFVDFTEGADPQLPHNS